MNCSALCTFVCAILFLISHSIISNLITQFVKIWSFFSVESRHHLRLRLSSLAFLSHFPKLSSRIEFPCWRCSSTTLPFHSFFTTQFFFCLLFHFPATLRLAPVPDIKPQRPNSSIWRAPFFNLHPFVSCQIQSTWPLVFGQLPVFSHHSSPSAGIFLAMLPHSLKPLGYKSKQTFAIPLHHQPFFNRKSQ